ncbi:MAG TPA: hypothetical protein VM487_12290 [Phycisphaerae bacterium]|nr:hypothetical protein [Phycisphaerae bacterium]
MTIRPSITIASMHVMILGAGAHAAAEEPVLVQPSWEVGHTIYVEWETEGIFRVDREEESSKMTVWETMGFLCTVVERLPKGGVRLQVTFDRFAAGDDISGTRMTSDSDQSNRSGVNDPFFEVLRPVLGESYTVELNAKGVVQCVRGLDKLLALVERVSRNELALRHAEVVLDEQMHMGMWDLFHAPYAFRAVRPGDTWRRVIQSYKGPNGYRFTAKRIDGGSDQRVHIEYTVAAVPSPETQAAERWWGVRYENRRMRARGTAVFVPKDGYIVEMRESGEERADMESKDGATGKQGTGTRQMSWRQSVVVLTKAERQRQKDRAKP